jgi:hypothetical protein
MYPDHPRDRGFLSDAEKREIDRRFQAEEDVRDLRRVVKAFVLADRWPLKPNELKRSLGTLAQRAGIETPRLKQLLVPIVSEIFAEAQEAFERAS